MLRIAFPEMTPDALGRMLPPGDTMNGERGGLPSRHAHRDRGHCGVSSSPESGDEAKFPWGPGCPYRMGKKELKKWAKAMKKTAQIHKRSAEAYASQAAAASTDPAPENQGQSQNQQSSRHPSFDFTAAAAQIQEVLNAFGVPIDVVELYDEWGNTSTRPNGGVSQPQAEAGVPVAASRESQNDERGTRPLSDQMQEMNLGSGQSGAEGENASFPITLDAAGTTESPLADGTSVHSNMDVEGEAGWTMLEAERLVDNTNRSTDANNSGTSATIPLEGSTQNQTESIREIPIRIEGGNPTTVASSTMDSTTITSNTPSGQGPIYPVLPTIHPQIQQVMEGISNAVGNVTRRYGPAAGWIPSPSSSISTLPAASQQPPQELNERMTMTLNQLLSMGFSNHDGWLARLVASKNGNLDDVLNSLFPSGNSV
jgi:hypothetical protein